MMWSNGFSGTLDLCPHPAGLPFYFDASVCALGVLGVGGLLASRGMPGTALFAVSIFSVLLWRRWHGARDARIIRVLARSDGEWRILLADGQSRRARLSEAWLLPGLVGGRWQDSRGRAYRCWLTRSGLGRSAWRRLRVRLRLPPGQHFA